MTRLVLRVRGGRGRLRIAALGVAFVAVAASLGLGLSEARASTPMPMLVASPGSSVSAPFVLTAGGASQKVTFTNTGGAATGVLTVTLVKSPSSAVFVISQNLCANVALGPKKTCTVTVSYPGAAPTTKQTATLTVTSKKPLVSASAFFAANPSLKISTAQQPASIAVGGSIADQAVVYGGNNPTGTVTFNLYNNATAAGMPLFTDTEPLSDGTATSISFTSTEAGTFYWVATYNGDTNNNSLSSAPGVEPVTITLATPAIATTQQPASATVGASIADQATVGGGFDPTGTVTFSLYNNASAFGTPLFTSTRDLSGGSATSDGYTATAAGTYYWVATYNGDTNNNPVSSGPGDEPVTVVAKASPGITTTEVGNVKGVFVFVSVPFSDQATVTGGNNPSGTVTFNLYDNPNGTGTPLFTDANEPLVGGVANSASYTATTAGATDYWVATYNGDSNNNSVSSGLADEPVIIVQFTATIATSQQPPSATVGSAIADQATVSGDSPTGTVTFDLYDSEGVGRTLLFTDTEQLVGGVATSKPFTTTATTPADIPLQWVATYNGDSNNDSASSHLGDEPVTITPGTP